MKIDIKLNYYWPVVFCAIIILALSISPGMQFPVSGISIDKAGHFVAYAVLNWMSLRAIWKNNKWAIIPPMLTTLVVSLYGIGLEFVQWAFFPHRFFEVWDMIANISGAITSFLVFKYFITKT